MSKTNKIKINKSEAVRDGPISHVRKKERNKTVDSPAEQVLHLQHTIGNQAVQRLFKSGTLQAKLKIGKPNDKYEQEADRVAEQVMRMPEPKISRQTEEEEEELIQPKPIAEQITPLVQRQAEPEEEEEEEPIQTKPIAEQNTPLVQRQEEEEELIQPKSIAEQISPLMQRQVEEEEEEEEPIQPKLLSTENPVLQKQEEEEEEEELIQSKPITEQITPLVQKQEEPEEEEEEEEPIQPKLFSMEPPTLQRQEEEEEEELIQAKLISVENPMLQKQEEEEELVQPKPIAEQITSLVQRQEEPEEEEEKEKPIQAKGIVSRTTVETPGIESSINSLRGGGQPLPESVKSYFEPRFGADFSHVRIRADSKAAETAKSINARAFTTGKNVVFGAGQYSPDTSYGRNLLAHELTHVIQQNKSSPTNINSSKDNNTGNVILRDVLGQEELLQKDEEYATGVKVKEEHDTGMEEEDYTGGDTDVGEQAKEKKGTKTKPIAEQIYPLMQRQIEEEEELIQPKPITKQITPRVQRQTEEEEESVQTKVEDVSSRLYSEEVLKEMEKRAPNEIAKYLKDNGFSLPEGIELGKFRKSPDDKRDLDTVVFAYEHLKGKTTTTKLLRFQTNGLLCYEIKQKKRNWKRPKVVSRTYYNAQGEVEKVRRKETLSIREMQEWRIRFEEQERRVEKRLYSWEDRRKISRNGIEGIKKILEEKPRCVCLPKSIEFEKFKRMKGAKFVFHPKHENKEGRWKETTEWLKFEKNGLLRHTKVIRTFERKKKRKKLLVGKPKIETSYYDAQGKLISRKDAFKRVKRKQKWILRMKTRKELKELYKYREQEMELGTPRGESMESIWNLASPDEFLQSGSKIVGATEKLAKAYNIILKQIDKLKIPADLNGKREQLEVELKNAKKEEDKKKIKADIKNINYLISNYLEVVFEIRTAVAYMKELEKLKQQVKKLRIDEPKWVRKRIWDQETNVEKMFARLSASKGCNVISYYLYGRAIGKIPENLRFSDYFIRELRKGLISIHKGRAAEIEAPYYGTGSGAWRDELGITKSFVHKTIPVSAQSRKNKLREFLGSGVRIANSWQDTRGDGKPNHFLLIAKDKNGVWRNMDHTSRNPERRGGYTNWDRVYGLYFGEASGEEKLLQFQSIFRRIFGKDWAKTIFGGGKETEQEIKR